MSEETFIETIQKIKSMSINDVIKMYNVNVNEIHPFYKEEFEYKNFKYTIGLHLYIYMNNYEYSININCNPEIITLMEQIYSNHFFYFEENLNEKNFRKAIIKAKKDIDLFYKTNKYLDEMIKEYQTYKKEYNKIIEEF